MKIRTNTTKKTRLKKESWEKDCQKLHSKLKSLQKSKKKTIKALRKRQESTLEHTSLSSRTNSIPRLKRPRISLSLSVTYSRPARRKARKIIIMRKTKKGLKNFRKTKLLNSLWALLPASLSMSA